MKENYTPDADNPGKAVVSSTTSKINLLGITTDMPFEVEEDDEGNNRFLVNGKEVKVTNVKVSFGGESYTLDEISGDTEGETLNFNIINDWMKKKDKTALIEAGKLIDTANVAIPGADDTLTIEFTISGLSENAGGDTSSTPSGNSSAAGGDSSKASDSSSKAGTTTTTTTKTTGTTAAGGGSDATETSAATGATAGLVFAGIALAGAALVVTKRK